MLILLAVLVLLAASTPVAAQTGANVLVVVNESVPESIEIGEHYARARAVPAEQVLRVKAEAADTIERAAYERSIEVPVAQWLARNAAHDRILYIVLVKGLPLRVAGSAGRSGTAASVDSELTLLYRKLTGQAVAPQGAQPNPYFLGDMAVSTAKPFSHADHDVFLVTRLDGFSVADAKGLVDRSTAARAGGRVVLDAKAAIDDLGNQWLAAAGEKVTAAIGADRVVADRTAEVVSGVTDVVGYYGWGSNDPAVKSRTTGLGFAPGAIAGTFVGGSARTFAEPPAAWVPGRGRLAADLFAGTSDALLGDLVREGVTGASGYVGDPFLDRSVRPDILLPAYLAGFSLAEAFYLSTPTLGWQGVVVGDPLCRPFGAPSLAAEQLDPGVDPATEMPREFSRRWIEAAKQPSQGGQRLPSREALAAVLRSQARTAKGDTPGAIAALEEATRLEPGLAGPQVTLATLYEQAGDHGKAAERYRAVLAEQNANVVALNNLAYLLATREGKPADALPLAERAYYVSRGTPVVTDTLAWVQHLLGNGTEAQRLIAQAVRGAPRNAELRYHAAAILQAAGKADAARAELKQAIDLDPALASRDDVKALQERLK